LRFALPFFRFANSYLPATRRRSSGPGPAFKKKSRR
jgi:hypothetical protein